MLHDAVLRVKRPLGSSQVPDQVVPVLTIFAGLHFDPSGLAKLMHLNRRSVTSTVLVFWINCPVAVQAAVLGSPGKEGQANDDREGQLQE